MDLNENKLRVMLEEHKGRGGEVERHLAKALKKIEGKETLEFNEFQHLFNVAVEYYRHVGAVWVLEGIKNGKEYDWRSVGKPKDA